jgi:acyl transferase domain-containing protein
MKPQNLEDPIAVVGYSLKFPQDGDTPQSFWDMLYEGRCASTDFPPDRLNVDAWYDSESAGARMVCPFSCGVK